MVYLGADHRGFELKGKIKTWLTEWGYEVEDCGNDHYDKEDDYPDFAMKVAKKVTAGNTGIVICGSGIGVSVAANRHAGIRCALGFNTDQVKHGRENDDINMLALAPDYTSEEEMKSMIKVFLETPFSGLERHTRRIGKIEKR